MYRLALTTHFRRSRQLHECVVKTKKHAGQLLRIEFSKRMTVSKSIQITAGITRQETALTVALYNNAKLSIKHKRVNKAATEQYIACSNIQQNIISKNSRRCMGKKKVKTSIYIARFMHQAPLTRTSLKLGRQTAI